ncbi:alpha/beta hydrolase domain-containing protein [Micromonospora sp. WMMD956]|uniref:alpha/beta hydrolase domain-containing protein n=1 Tax=Micromonospora TaxID=1873 RepID=UPI002415CBEC|nr:alpha/beta hydrolase domain-containing protein [Micromonospora sp. WMMD956]MDG4817408.1 alpha/beta hydrolase domain-containing protein [Micromonospora sp. WMMD956]
MPVLPATTPRTPARRSLIAFGLAGALAVTAGPVAPAAAAGRPAGPTPPRQSTATGANVANPVVAGPIARTTPVGDSRHGYPFLATDVDLAAAGYVEEEFFLFGTATRYAVQGTQDAVVLGADQPYGTRLVVRRPANTGKFNGVVIAEWNNVSNQWDQEVDWFQSHEHLIREGYAWVGVSAQRAGLHSATGLKAWSPGRYGPLDLTVGGTVTDDSLSYDVFSQAVKAVRHPTGVDPLGRLPAPRYVIATGHSQSAGRLANYYNGVQRSANVLDAVVLHGGGGVLRTDLATPVFRLNSEGDVASGILPAAARSQADSPVLRSWEVAGASHGDWKLITDYGPLRKRDIGSYPGGYPGEPQTCTLPSLSRVPQHMVQNAVYDHTVAWVAHGVAPPAAPRIDMTGTTPPAVARDDLGLALGGIRLAQHEVPLRINSGSNSGPGFCFLDGSSVPLTDAQLATLYPTVRSYVDASVAATLLAADAGHLPRSFTRDPAWYSDLRDLIGEYVAAGRISEYAAARLEDRLRRAEQAGTAGNTARAGALLEQLADRAEKSITRDPAARDAVLRTTEALIALLDAAERRAR